MISSTSIIYFKKKDVKEFKLKPFNTDVKKSCLAST